MTAALVLIVDDDPDTRDMLRAALSGAEMQPVTAFDGAAALDMLRGMSPDLILLDAVMPGLDGFDTCSRIKAMPEVSHIPVMFMTGPFLLSMGTRFAYAPRASSGQSP